jgi:probable phosphoglycerate mutase
LESFYIHTKTKINLQNKFMIAKEIYVIRHGQTEHNKNGIVQGKGVNLPLNELGIQQSQAFFDAYKQVPFDIIYTSTLLRAQQTIAPFKELGIPHEVFSELDEISWGNMEGKANTMESSEEFKLLLDEWQQGNIDAKPEGGESPRELQQRQLRFVDALKKSSAKKILVSMHGRAIRCLMCTLTNTPLSKMEEFKHVNLTLYKVHLLENGKFEIVANNATEHLQQLNN